MVRLARLDVRDEATAVQLLELQRRAYRVEAELIGSEEIPPLREALAELQDCGETFLGATVRGVSRVRFRGVSTARRSMCTG